LGSKKRGGRTGPLLDQKGGKGGDGGNQEEKKKNKEGGGKERWVDRENGIQFERGNGKAKKRGGESKLGARVGKKGSEKKGTNKVLFDSKAQFKPRKDAVLRQQKWGQGKGDSRGGEGQGGERNLKTPFKVGCNKRRNGWKH